MTRVPLARAGHRAEASIKARTLARSSRSTNPRERELSTEGLIYLNINIRNAEWEKKMTDSAIRRDASLEKVNVVR